MWLFARAAAMDLEVTAEWPAPAETTAVAPAPYERVLTTGPGGTTLFDAYGEEIETFAEAGVALASTDTDVWVCGTAGVWHLDSARILSQVSSEPCTAADAIDDRVLVAGASVFSLLADGTRTETDLPLGTILVAAERDATASLGDSDLHVVGDWGVDTIGTGGPIGGFAWDGVDWLWSLAAEAVIAMHDGTRRPVEPEPGLVELGDIDGDGLADVVVAHRDALGVLLADAAEELLWTGAVDSFAVGQVDTDECAEILVLQSGTVRVLELGCGVWADLDDDGYTPAGGDCDDDAADVHPGAAETCDSRDEDCDGNVDGYIGGWLPEITGVEGQEIRTPLALPPCADQLSFATTIPDGFASCDVAAAELLCTLIDDGEGFLYVRATDRAGNLEVEDAWVRSANVAPTITGTIDDLSGTLAVDHWIQGQFTATDPGRDSISWSVVNGPPGLHIEPDGSVNWQVGADDAGDWSLTIVADDEDGGRATWDTTIHVPETCGCQSASPTPTSTLALLFLVRRRRCSS